MKWLNNLKDFYWRGKRGYADSDCWDVDNYLARIVPPMLRTMIDPKKGGGHGYPGGDEQTKTLKRWHRVVEQMASAFEESIKTDEMEYVDMKQWKRDWAKSERKRIKGMNLFVKYFNSLWD